MKTLKETTLRMLQMHYEANVGHIGGNLSCLPIIYTLFHDVMQPDDLFILSKGHSAGALYAVLWSLGRISDEELKTFHQDNTRLAGHPIGGSFPDIRFSTGSLGHGLGLACGVAHARKLSGSPGRVYCLLSDGELQEGSTHEAFLYMARKPLHVTAIIDKNGFQGIESTESSGMGLSTYNLTDYFYHLGIPAGATIDFSDYVSKCRDALGGGNIYNNSVLIVETTKGAGVSFLENRIESHYLPLTAEQYAQARQEIESC